MNLDEHNKKIYLIAVLTAMLFAAIIIIVTNAWGSQYKPFNNHDAVIQQILYLESGNKHIPCGYSSTCKEIGIAQFKPDTFKLFQRKSGMHFLSIYEADDQVAMLNWALLNGYGNHWSTFKKAQERAIMSKYIKLR
jgi:hypothetical protein